MADTKISAATAVSSVAGTNEFAVNEAGSSKRATATQIKTFVNTSPVWTGSATANSWPEFTSGTVLASPEAGAIEFDGKCFYQTAINSARQVSVCEQFLFQSATQTATSSAAAQTWFPSNTLSIVAVAAATTYQFDGQLHLANGATTHTTALLFALAGGASLTSIKYSFLIGSVAENTAGVNALMGTVNQAASTVLNATSVAVGAHIYIRGLMRVNAAGTVAPQFQWSANPTGTNQVLLNTYFRLWPVGSNTVLSVGNWT